PRTQDPGPRTQDPGPRTQDPGPRTQDPGPRTKDQDPGPRTRTQPLAINQRSIEVCLTSQNPFVLIQISLASYTAYTHTCTHTLTTACTRLHPHTHAHTYQQCSPSYCLSIGNLALGKVAYASSFSPGYPARNAVDGNLSTTSFSGRSDDPAKWFSVDLGMVWDISRILVWPYQYCCWYDHMNIEVRVGLRNISSVDDTYAIVDNQQVWKQNGSTSANPDDQRDPFVINLQPAVTGRWVTVQNFNPNQYSFLYIAEIEVYGNISTSPMPPSPPPRPPRPSSSPKPPSPPPSIGLRNVTI
ncbi:hypothetical protein Vafri_16206, partial [Volvox africanus]